MHNSSSLPHLPQMERLKNCLARVFSLMLLSFSIHEGKKIYFFTFSVCELSSGLFKTCMNHVHREF